MGFMEDRIRHEAISSPGADQENSKDRFNTVVLFCLRRAYPCSIGDARSFLEDLS